MKTYLAVASHWSVPGVRQYGAPDRATAERKAVEFVNELIEDWARWLTTPTDATVPPPVIGSNWESSLRALQLSRLIDYSGGEGEANDALFDFVKHRDCDDEPDVPLIGEKFTLELQELIGEFVADDEESTDPIGFPMVWIEEVESAESAEPGPVDQADLETVIALAQRFIDEGAPADDPAEHKRYEAVIERLKAPHAPYPPAFGALDLGAILSVIGWARQFTADWNEDAIGEGSPEECMLAAAASLTVDTTERSLKALFPLLARIDAALDGAADALQGLDEQLDQLVRFTRPTFDDDTAIERAREEAEECGAICVANRMALVELGKVPTPPARVLINVGGGLVQGIVSDGNVTCIIADYDQDGVDPDEEGLVDTAKPNDTREEFASVYEEDTLVDPAEIERVLALKAIAAARRERRENNQCVECGGDLDAPSAAGAEDGVCGPCIAKEDE